MFDVDAYADNSAVQRESTVQAISKYGHYLEWPDKNEEIMDIGCADGWVTVNILKPFLSINSHKGTLHAVDFNKKCIERARRDHEMPGITFDVMDFTSEQDANKYANGMDKIFSFYSLHWGTDLRICFKNIHKMLKNGGILFATFDTGENVVINIYEHMLSNKWKTYCRGAMKQLYLSPLYQAHDPEKFVRDIAEETNFKVSICKMITNDFTFVNFDQLKGLFLSVPGLCSHLSQSLKDELFEELKITTRNGTLLFPNTCILVIATKK